MILNGRCLIVVRCSQLIRHCDEKLETLPSLLGDMNVKLDLAKTETSEVTRAPAGMFFVSLTPFVNYVFQVEQVGGGGGRSLEY